MYPIDPTQFFITVLQDGESDDYEAVVTAGRLSEHVEHVLVRLRAMLIDILGPDEFGNQLDERRDGIYDLGEARSIEAVASDHGIYPMDCHMTLYHAGQHVYPPVVPSGQS